MNYHETTEVSSTENGNNLRIISKPHAYLQTMTKTPVKFQYKTVGGVAHTGHPLTLLYTRPKKKRRI